MKEVGKLPWCPRPDYTCEHRGRLFSFSADQEKLVVTEVIVGETARCVSATVRVRTKLDDSESFVCCSLGRYMLVIPRCHVTANSFAALVDVDKGPLNDSTSHAVELIVEGTTEADSFHLLYPVSPSRALLLSDQHWDMWYCDVRGKILTLKKAYSWIPTRWSLRTVPVRLPDGRLLMTGQEAYSIPVLLISCNEKPTFEKIGELPGLGRWWLPAALIGERFVVGFGGIGNERHSGTLWLFDLQTRKASPVAAAGNWPPTICDAKLVVQMDGLYFIGNTIYSISFQALSALIQDVDFQVIFQEALGYQGWKNSAVRGMRNLRGGLAGCLFYNTIAYGGKLLHFSQCQGKLCVTEILIGWWVRTKTVNTGIDCKTCKDWQISCCSFSDKILVFSGHASDFFCALVSIDPGELTREPIHIDEKRVTGWGECDTALFLVQIAENKVWASFYNSDEIWIGELKDETLDMTKHPDHFPVEGGFGTVPLRLPDGKFLVAGAKQKSTDITLITPGEHFHFEKAGDMPGEGMEKVSTILIGERFIVGFGGWNYKDTNDMWIFDLKTHRVSAVKKEGEWCPATCWPFLTVHNQDLCILGGWSTEAAHSLPFRELSTLILDYEIRSAFCVCLGPRVPLDKELSGRISRHYTPPSL